MAQEPADGSTSVNSDVTVSYKGNTIAELNQSGNKTLKTSGKYCEDNIQIVYTKSAQSDLDAFWDSFQNKGKRTQYGYAFTRWTDDIYNPRYPIICGDVTGMFSNASITDTKVTIDASGGVMHFSNLKLLFQNASNLVTVRKLITQKIYTYDNTFQNCAKLENITIEGEVGKSINFKNSPLLSKTSINNIVTVLSDDVTGQTLTLSAAAVNSGFETAEGLADGSTSSEWLLLVNTKPNWTVSLI